MAVIIHITAILIIGRIMAVLADGVTIMDRGIGFMQAIVRLWSPIRCILVQAAATASQMQDALLADARIHKIDRAECEPS